MRALWPLLIAGLLLLTGLLVGCNQEPERMKNQPTNLEPKSGGVDRKLPGGGTKHFEAVR
jgi:hypothetical protein